MKTEDLIVFVGEKPLFNYVQGVMHQLGKGGESKVVGRGKFISKAVDVAEIIKHQLTSDFSPSSLTQNIEIGSDEFKNKEGKTIRVSTIEITLTKTERR